MKQLSKSAIKAVYADYKRVKTRKVHQITFEVPSEQWPEIYRVLGEPDIETSSWFGIAAMGIDEPAPTAQEQGKNYAANAAIMLDTPAFRKFLAEPHDGFLMFDKTMADEELKELLGIKSKSEINTNQLAAQKWRDLRGQYEAWLRT